jgi:DNA-binding MarR family transcriptional regulator
MSTDSLDPVIHAPVRLRIVATLAALPAGDTLSFTRLQDILELTAGNLITHLRKLEDAGYLTSETTGNGRASRTSLALTSDGRAALANCTKALRPTRALALTTERDRLNPQTRLRPHHDRSARSHPGVQSHQHTTSKRLHPWWTSPPRSGPRLIISPIEYRHLRAFGRVRIASGIVLTGLGTLTLAFGGNDRETYGWASLFLAGAAANLASGCWELAIAPETDQQSRRNP